MITRVLYGLICYIPISEYNKQGTKIPQAQKIKPQYFLIDVESWIYVVETSSFRMIFLLHTYINQVLLARHWPDVSNCSIVTKKSGMCSSADKVVYSFYICGRLDEQYFDVYIQRQFRINGTSFGVSIVMLIASEKNKTLYLVH